MSKLHKIIILLIVLAAGVVAYKWMFESVWLTTSSPNKTYTVELTGDKSRGGLIIPSVVGYRVFKEGLIIAKNSSVHSGDWMDISFELAYPENAWVSENVIRFWRNPHIPEEKDKVDTLLISNDTGKTIKYLEVKSRDMFLVFDIQPHSALKLSFTNQSWNSYVWVEGEFEDGQNIGDYEVVFSHPDKLNEPFRYCAVINYNQVKIESPQFDGHDKNGNSANLNIPKSANCNP
jgi:hypothetical protein